MHQERPRELDRDAVRAVRRHSCRTTDDICGAERPLHDRLCLLLEPGHHGVVPPSDGLRNRPGLQRPWRVQRDDRAVRLLQQRGAGLLPRQVLQRVPAAILRRKLLGPMWRQQVRLRAGNVPVRHRRQRVHLPRGPISWLLGGTGMSVVQVRPLWRIVHAVLQRNRQRDRHTVRRERDVQRGAGGRRDVHVQQRLRARRQWLVHVLSAGVLWHQLQPVRPAIRR